MIKTMNEEKHKERHIRLHQSFDELQADFMNHTGKLPSKTTLGEFAKWSSEQMFHPTPNKEVDDNVRAISSPPANG